MSLRWRSDLCPGIKSVLTPFLRLCLPLELSNFFTIMAALRIDQFRRVISCHSALLDLIMGITQGEKVSTDYFLFFDLGFLLYTTVKKQSRFGQTSGLLAVTHIHYIPSCALVFRGVSSSCALKVKKMR